MRVNYFRVFKLARSPNTRPNCFEPEVVIYIAVDPIDPIDSSCGWQLLTTIGCASGRLMDNVDEETSSTIQVISMKSYRATPLDYYFEFQYLQFSYCDENALDFLLVRVPPNVFLSSYSYFDSQNRKRGDPPGLNVTDA